MKNLYDMSRFTVDENQRYNGRNERLKPFVDRLEQSRKESGYKPLGAKFYAMKMSHISTDELDAFYKKLDQSDSFCKLWWWYTKPVDNSK